MFIFTNFLAKILKLFEKKPLVLGRWQRHDCNIKTTKKIDWANIDHCGPCGYSKINDKKFKIEKTRL